MHGDLYLLNFNIQKKQKPNLRPLVESLPREVQAFWKKIKVEKNTFKYIYIKLVLGDILLEYSVSVAYRLKVYSYVWSTNTVCIIYMPNIWRYICGILNKWLIFQIYDEAPAWSVKSRTGMKSRRCGAVRQDTLVRTTTFKFSWYKYIPIYYRIVS